MSRRFREQPAGYATQMQRNTGTSLDMRARRGCERNGKKRRGKEEGGVRLDNESGMPPFMLFDVWMPDVSPRAKVKNAGRDD